MQYKIKTMYIYFNLKTFLKTLHKICPVFISGKGLFSKRRMKYKLHTQNKIQ